MDAGAFAAIMGAVVARVLPWPLLLVLIAVPQAVAQRRLVLGQPDQKQLHLAWLNGVKLHMQFGIFLIVGILASAVLHN
jgi:1,4-dihydroxy-2-naphthoate octaprenyltransferase